MTFKSPRLASPLVWLLVVVVVAVVVVLVVVADAAEAVVGVPVRVLAAVWSAPLEAPPDIWL